MIATLLGILLSCTLTTPVAPCESVTPPPPNPVVAGPAKKAVKKTSARYGGKRWARGDWKRFPARIEQAAWCVVNHESIHVGLWTAQNPVSSASGAFQIIDGTWRAFQERAHVRPKNRTAHAKQAPPRRQARVFAKNWPTSKSAWFGTGCYPGSPTW